MSNKLSWSALFCCFALLAIGCSDRHGRPASGGPAEPGSAPAPSARTLTLKGSDTMVILAQKWAEAFMRSHPGTTLQVTGGGSGTGIAALQNGTADLANSSRQIKDREREQIRTQRGAEVVEHRVALDALAIYVHPSNSVPSLSLEQLEGIYRGTITDWSAVGGPRGAIVLYSRENNSGTYAYFKEHVLKDADFAPTAATLQGTAAVVHSVSRDPLGIGYGGIAYGGTVRAVPIRLASGEVIAPTMENAVSGTYPIARFLYVYSVGAPQGLALEYLDFIRSSDGQGLVEGVGFFPLPTGGGAAPAPAPATP